VATEYDDKQKAEALSLYAEHGPAEAGRRTGIPRTTISRWAGETGVRTDREAKTREATKAAAEKAAKLRETLKSNCRDRAVDLIHRMEEMHVEFVGKDGRREEVAKATAAACKDYAVAVGVLIDKAELLDGRATSRQETRNIDQMDREIERLLVGDGHPEPVGS
jgi:hypothetical protein